MNDIVWTNLATNPEMHMALARYIDGRIWERPRGLVVGTILGVFRNNKLLGAMAFHDYDSTAQVIQVSGAAESPRWLTKKVLWEMFSFPFIQLQCQMVVMRVSERNTRLQRILTSYGFESIRISRLRGRDQAEILYTLTDDNWFSNGFHDKELRNGQSVTPGADTSERNERSQHIH